MPRTRSILFSLLSVAILASATTRAADAAKPNIVIIFLDDSGFGDYRPFGDPPYPTPHVEQLADEGCSYQNFYVPQAICSASRSALMTGCYPGRTKMFGAHAPRQKGLDPKFPTMAEILKSGGYATGFFGKWHLGDHPDTRPPARGFDESCGLMYSNDMWEFHPEKPEFWGKWPLQYWKNGRVTIPRVTTEHQPMLTTWYTEQATDFIRRHADEPFFVYLPHSMPHVPIFVSDKFKGKSGAGLYGDVMMELDWSVGQVNQTLKDCGVAENTIVIFTSDNGPWVSYGNHAGVTPFREAKATGFDGGIRSACIVKYPKQIRPGTTSDRTFCSIDLLPTLASLAGAALPDSPIDGRNVWDLMTGKPGVDNPHIYYPFSTGKVFEGVLTGDGRWKLHLPHSYRTLVTPGTDAAAGKYENVEIELSLFDMKNDPLETTNVIDQHPEIAAKLKVIAERHKNAFYGK